MKSLSSIPYIVFATLLLNNPLTVAAPTHKNKATKPVKASKTTKAVKKSFSKQPAPSGFLPQSDEIKALANQVNNGIYVCDANIVVRIEKPTDPLGLGYINITHQKITTPLLPITTDTGALRLENVAKGLVWLQLPSKSMLMNNKLGQRLADNCHTPVVNTPIEPIQPVETVTPITTTPEIPPTITPPVILVPTVEPVVPAVTPAMQQPTKTTI